MKLVSSAWASEEQLKHRQCSLSTFIISLHVFDRYTTYNCLETEGAVLELPLGATRFEARNIRGFKRLASLCAENWYKYAIVDRGREISNGSLYLVTACVKCKHCGIAVFHSPPAPEDYIRFTSESTPRAKYGWEGSASIIGKICPHAELANATESEQNQCIFLRGFKIMLSQDVWNSVASHRDAILTNLEASSLSFEIGRAHV